MNIGDRVIKVTGDYAFNGIIVSKFNKLNGAERYVAENKEGILFIFSSKQLKGFNNEL